MTPAELRERLEALRRNAEVLQFELDAIISALPEPRLPGTKGYHDVEEFYREEPEPPDSEDMERRPTLLEREQRAKGSADKHWRRPRKRDEHGRFMGKYEFEGVPPSKRRRRK